MTPNGKEHPHVAVFARRTCAVNMMIHCWGRGYHEKTGHWPHPWRQGTFPPLCRWALVGITCFQEFHCKGVVPPLLARVFPFLQVIQYEKLFDVTASRRGLELEPVSVAVSVSGS